MKKQKGFLRTISLIAGDIKYISKKIVKKVQKK